VWLCFIVVLYCSYNLQALQEQLDRTSSMPLPTVLPPTSLQGAVPTSMSGVGAAISRAMNTNTVYDFFRGHTKRTLDHIQALKMGSIRVNVLKQRYSGAPLIPRMVHNEITTLERGLKLDTSVLHDMIQQLNAGLADFLQSPLSANKSLVAVIQKDRQNLQNELEQLKQILTPTGNSTGHMGPTPIPNHGTNFPVPQVPISWTGGHPPQPGPHPPHPGSRPPHPPTQPAGVSVPRSHSQLLQANPQRFPQGNVHLSEVSSTTEESLPFYR
jgi:hypothetical protein